MRKIIKYAKSRIVAIKIEKDCHLFNLSCSAWESEKAYNSFLVAWANFRLSFWYGVIGEKYEF